MEEEEVDFEPEDAMEDGAGGSGAGGGSGGRRKKGRGQHAAMDDERYSGRDGVFESLDTEGGSGPARCE
jgi:hypothetical protein